MAGARAKPISSNLTTRAFRAAEEVPPNIVAIMRSPPRSAEATKFEPAARVYPVLIPSAPL